MMSSTGVMPPLIFGRKAYPKGSAKSSLQNEDHGPARALPRFAAPAVRAGTPGEAPLPAPRFFPTLRGHVAIHSRPIRRIKTAMCYAARQPMKALSLSVSPLVRATATASATGG